MTQSSCKCGSQRPLCRRRFGTSPAPRRMRGTKRGQTLTCRSSRLWRREGVRRSNKGRTGGEGAENRGFHLLRCVSFHAGAGTATRWGAFRRETEREGREGTVAICFPFFSLSLGLNGCFPFVTPLCPHPFLGCTVSAVRVKNLSEWVGRTRAFVIGQRTTGYRNKRNGYGRTPL